MKPRASLTLACLGAVLPFGAALALADPPTPAASDPVQATAPKETDSGAKQIGLSSDVSNALGETAEPTAAGMDTADNNAWRGDQIRFTSDSGHLIARPWVIAKGDLAEWDGRHSNPNYQIEFGLMGSWYNDITYDFAGFVGYNTGLTWREATIGYRGFEALGQHIVLTAGLYDSIYWKEQGQVDDQNTLFLYRSLLTYTIGSVEYGNLVGGASAYWGDPMGNQPLLLGMSIHSIANSQPFQPDLIGATNTLTARHIAMAMRADWMPFGDRDETHDLSGRIGTHDTFDVGGGFAWDDFDTADLIRMTVDAQYTSPRRWTAFGALDLNYTNFATTMPTTGVDSRTDWGFLLQGGYYFTPWLEGIARYDYTHVDGAFRIPGARSHFQEFSIGVNWFPGPPEWRNHVKLMAALNVLPDGIAPVQDLNYTGTIPGKSRIFLQFGGQISF